MYCLNTDGKPESTDCLQARTCSVVRLLNFFLHCVQELLSSFKVRTSKHVQELEKCLASLGGSVAFVCLTILFVQEEKDLCKSYRNAIRSSSGPGKQFDLIDNKFL